MPTSRTSLPALALGHRPCLGLPDPRPAPRRQCKHTGVCGAACRCRQAPCPGPCSPRDQCLPRGQCHACPLQLVPRPPGLGQHLLLARAPLSPPCSRLAARPGGKVSTSAVSVRPVMSARARPRGLGSARAMLFVFAGSGLQPTLVPRGGDGGRDGHGRCSCCPRHGPSWATLGEGTRTHRALRGRQHRTTGSAHPGPVAMPPWGLGKLLPVPQPFPGRAMPGEMAQAVRRWGGAGLSPAMPWHRGGQCRCGCGIQRSPG